MQDFKNKVIPFCDKLSWIFMCIIIFDLCIFGAGQLISVGPLGFRQIFLLLLGFSCIPLVINNWKELFKNKFIWAVLIFALWLLFSTFIGLSNNNPMLVQDFNGYFYMIFLPLAVIVINSKERVHTLMKIMIYGSLILSLFVIVYLLIYLNSKDLFDAVASFGFNNYFSRVGYISKSIPRIYMMSGLYMISGCAFSIYFNLFGGSEKGKWLYYIVPGVCIFALMLSYTRSVYLAACLAAFIIVAYIFFAFDKEQKHKLFKQLAVGASVCVLLSVSFSVIANTNYLGYAISRTSMSVSDEDDISNGTIDSENVDEFDYYNQMTLASDEKRQKTVEQTVEYIKKSPVIGHGLGFTIPFRPDGNEYSYLDIWLKMGIVGLLLYMIPFVLLIVDLFKTKKKELIMLKITWIAILVGFMGYSIFNPYFNSSLGIFMYCCCMAIAQLNTKTND